MGDGQQGKPLWGAQPRGIEPAAVGRGRVPEVPVYAAWSMGASRLLCGSAPVLEGGGSDRLLPSPQTRVLVTHGISFLPQTDFIIVLADGQVSEMGTYPALLQRNDSFANFLHNYAPDEGQEHLEEDGRTGIPGPLFLCPPDVFPVLGVSESLWTGPVLYKGGAWAICVMVRHHQAGNGTGYSQVLSPPLTLTVRPWISSSARGPLVFPRAKGA